MGLGVGCGEKIVDQKRAIPKININQLHESWRIANQSYLPVISLLTLSSKIPLTPDSLSLDAALEHEAAMQRTYKLVKNAYNVLRRPSSPTTGDRVEEVQCSMLLDIQDKCPTHDLNPGSSIHQRPDHPQRVALKTCV